MAIRSMYLSYSQPNGLPSSLGQTGIIAIAASVVQLNDMGANLLHLEGKSHG